MRILVTGGMGFIGHNVVARLEDMGHDVEILDKMTNYGIIPKDELTALIEERSSHISSICHIYDIGWAEVENTFKAFEPEMVIHLASFPRQKVVNADPMLGSRTMIEGLLNLCELSCKYKVKKFVYISSSMVYGDFNGITNEYSPCAAQGQYGVMKLAGEWLVKDYAYRSCFDYTIVRPSAVYGPRDVEDRVVSKFFLSAMRGETLKVNGAKEKLDFTYIDDTVDGIILAALSTRTNFKTYNVARGKSRTILEAAQLVVNIVGKGTIDVGNKSVDYPSRGTLSIHEITRDLGFAPKIDIEEGFQRYYEYLQSSPFWSSKAVQ